MQGKSNRKDPLAFIEKIDHTIANGVGRRFVRLPDGVVKVDFVWIIDDETPDTPPREPIRSMWPKLDFPKRA